MPVSGTDTHRTARTTQVRVLRGLDPSFRFQLAIDMSLAARALLVARLRTERPGLPAAEIRRETFALIYPGIPLPPGIE